MIGDHRYVVIACLDLLLKPELSLILLLIVLVVILIDAGPSPCICQLLEVRSRAFLSQSVQLLKAGEGCSHSRCCLMHFGGRLVLFDGIGCGCSEIEQRFVLRRGLHVGLGRLIKQ